VKQLPATRLIEISENRWAYYALAALLRLALDLVYVHSVSWRAWQMGFPVDIGPDRYALSWATYLACAALLPRSTLLPSNYALGTLLFVFVAPLCSLYGLTQVSTAHFFTMVAAYVIATLAAGTQQTWLPTFRRGPILAVAVCVAVTALTFAWMLHQVGVATLNLDLRRIYELRAQLDVMYQGPFAYLMVWTPKVFLTFLLCFALWRRNWPLAAAAIALEIAFFAFAQHRAILVYPFAVLFIHWHMRHFRTVNLLPLALTGVIAASLLLFKATGSWLMTSILVRRAFFVPPRDAFLYFEYFAKQDHVYWSNSVLSRFLSYPFPEPPQKLIAAYQASEGWVNSGFIPTGYMHAGLAGVAFYALALGLLLRLLNALSSRLPPWFTLAVAIAPLLSLLFSADLPTSLLTHGLGPALVLLVLAGGAPHSQHQQQANPVHQEIVRRQQP